MSDASLVAQIAAHIKWGACTDRTEATAPARRKFLDSFAEKIREEFPGIDEATALQMAESRKRAHFKQLARKSAQVRSARKAAREAKAAS